MAINQNRDSKSFLTHDFQKSIEIEEYPITIEYNSPLTASVNFLRGVYYDASNGTLTSSLSSSNTATTQSNSSALVSFTGLYNHAASFLYYNSLTTNTQISDRNNSLSPFLREITIPIKQFGDRIKKNTFKLSLQKDTYNYSRFLRIKNDADYDYGQNASFVYFNDEDWLVSSSSLNEDFSFVINFRLSEDWLKKVTTSSVTQYLIYQPKIYSREDANQASCNWTYSVSAIQANDSYENTFINKFDKTRIYDEYDTAFGLRLIYYNTTAQHPLSGRFVFESIINQSVNGSWPAINSSATSNSQTGTALSSLTSSKNLADGKWHQILFTKEDGGERARIYLDAVNLIGYFYGAQFNQNVGNHPFYFISQNKIESPPTILLGAKIFPIDQQAVSLNTRILEQSKGIDISYLYRQKKIPIDYNIAINSLSSIDKGIDPGGGYGGENEYPWITISGSNTNIYSYFGATNIEKFLATYYKNTNDKIPSSNFILNNTEYKKMQTSKIASEFGVFGFNGDIASFYIYNSAIDKIYDTTSGSPTAYPAYGINLSGQFKSLFSWKQFAQKEYLENTNASSGVNLFGNFQFYKEVYGSCTVKNRIFSKAKYYKNIENELYNYYGAGVFINHENFLKNKDLNIPNSSIFNEFDFYDVPEKTLSSELSHGKIMYKDSLKNVKDCGLIFYDLGIITLDTNIFLTNTITSSLLSSISSGTRLLFYPNSITSNHFYIDEINYGIEKFKFVNTINVVIEQNEFSKSTNNSQSEKTSDISFPTTIAFYNDNNECMYVSKINQHTEKNKFLKLTYKTKIAF